MKIIAKDTIADVLRAHGPLFKLGMREITDQAKKFPAPKYLGVKRKFLPDKRIKTRSLADATIGELDVLNDRTTAEKYFFNVLGVMSGLIHFKANLPDGKPDWASGWEIDETTVLNLRFIDAFRYFLQIQMELEGVAKAWSALGSWNKKSGKKRPNRGLISVCRQYCRLVEGAVKPSEVWNLPWPVVFEAFESCDYDNKEQAEAYEAAKNKSNSKRK